MLMPASVPELLNILGEMGSLQSALEIWTSSGTRCRIVDVYIDEEDDGTVCIDIEEVRE